MIKKKEKLIIVAPSGSGKDFLLRGLVNKGLKYSPKFTTRPQRSLEQQGIDYNFISVSKFDELKEDFKIKVYQTFLIKEEVWYYGISKENFDDNQVFIMTPHEISSISEEDRVKLFIVYLDIDESVRRSRISSRNDDNDSVERRIDSDREDFKDFKDYDLKITDSEFEVDWVYDLMD